MPAAPLAQTSSTVFVDATSVDLCGEDLVVEFEPRWTDDGLVEVDPDGDAARILTGQEIGEIHVTAQLWDGPPPLPDDLDAWQDISEVSAAWRSAFLDFGTTGTAENPAERLSLPGPGDYRLRVHGRHRDDGDPRDTDQPVEEYLIQLWPAPQAEAHVIRSTSATAAGWRA
ncbi:hypothetical protein [Streptomyces odontomachi]|uniref:hypothetical protein n=1 Tax=Streptomyces odontomachi TaxID=2944940 RepID=UPI00210DE447|nr:hypothetical protein [Streptomyces sp. ODS25]